MKRTGKLLLTVSVISFIIAFAEGYLFYGEFKEFVLVHLLLSVQNGVKAFWFSPDISATDVLAVLKETEQLWHHIIGHAYIICTFAAPVCTAGVLFQMIRLLLYKGRSLRRKKTARRIVIFGYNENVKALLKNLWEGHGEVIHIVTDKDFSSSEELEIVTKEVILHKVDCLNLSGKALEQWIKKTELCKASDMILFEDSAYKNFSLYLFLADLLKRVSDSHVKVYCSCEERGIQEILENFYDSGLKGKEEESSQCQIDLEMFSVPELRARELFADSRHPVYQYNLESGQEGTKKWDVHLLIAGLGNLGLSVITQAINQSVLHSRSRIIIDVIDQDIEVKFSRLANQFSSAYTGITEDRIEIASPTADGMLLIRPHRLDVQEKKMEQLLCQISEDMPVTYAILCLKNSSHSIPCMLKLQEFFAMHNKGNVPIAIRMEGEKELAKYIDNNSTRFKNLFLIPGVEEVVSIDKICDTDLDRKAKAFHKIYSGITFVSRSDYSPSKVKAAPKEPWESLEFFKKESNRYLCYHEHVKKMRCACREFGESMTAPDQSGLYWGILERHGSCFLIPDDMKELVNRINQDPFLREMAMLEHRRWNYFMLLHGWRYTDGEKDVGSRQTPYLTEWEKLCREHPGTCIYDLMSLCKVITDEGERCGE